jgi:hypothetical protein
MNYLGTNDRTDIFLSIIPSLTEFKDVFEFFPNFLMIRNFSRRPGLVNKTYKRSKMVRVTERNVNLYPMFMRFTNLRGDLSSTIAHFQYCVKCVGAEGYALISNRHMLHEKDLNLAGRL